MSSIGWVIRPVTRVSLNAPTQNERRKKRKKKNPVVEYLLPRITGGWIGKRQIIYVWDWSVSSDPIISWDVNYTVLSLHVKRQIIEEGKRCATLYLCFHLELLDRLAFVRFLSLFFLLSFFSLSMMYLLLGNITLSELIILQWHYSQSLPRPVCVCVCRTHTCIFHPVSAFTFTVCF